MEINVEAPTAIITPIPKERLKIGMAKLAAPNAKGPTYFPIKIPSTIVYKVKIHMEVIEGIAN